MNEIQVSSSGVPATSDIWGQGGLPGQPQAQPLKKIHRLLRGRYPLAITLAVIFAIVGGLAGYLLPPVTYRSDGFIEIKPYMPSILEIDRVMPMYNSYVMSQTTMLTGQRVLDAAIASDDWKKYHPGSGVDDLATITQNLDVSNVKLSQLIRVSYTDNTPDSAEHAVRAIIGAYMQLYGDMDSRERRDKINMLETRQTMLNSSIQAKQKLILGMAEDYGAEDLAPLHNAKMQELVALESELTQSRLALKAADDANSNRQAHAQEVSQIGMESLIPQIAQVDATMRNYLHDKEQLELRIEQLKRTFGEKHRIMINAREDLDLANDRIDKYAREFLKTRIGKINAEGQPMTPTELAQIHNRVNELEKVYKVKKDETLMIGKQRLQITGLRNEVEALRGSLTETSRRIDELNAEAAMAGRITVRSYGDKPAFPAGDKRKQFTVLGVLMGGALPIAFMLLFGLSDRSYRYSDDTDEDMAGLQMLGILPNLPDRLNDPQQAGTAADCVHQIRTMLQIHGRPDHKTVVAITSPAAGDGKTSLALALGLSYAACGSSTLLIDCDLVGAGLTTRLNIRNQEGVLEAVANRNLLTFVQNTDIANVAVLPVGASQKLHPSTLSPMTMKLLVAEARKHFDTIIIDTGPILGSIEASLVVAAADRVILTVSRGQQRPIVERAMAHLSAIGANIAGVVFNRAQASDFERNMGAGSVRSTGGNGAGPTRPAPAPDKGFAASRAVASAIKPSSGK